MSHLKTGVLNVPIVLACRYTSGTTGEQLGSKGALSAHARVEQAPSCAVSPENP